MWVPLRKLFAPPGVPSWLRAWLTQPLQNEIRNTAISADFIKFSECHSRCANAKSPIVKTFWRRFWFKSHNLSRDRLVATCVRFSAMWKI